MYKLSEKKRIAVLRCMLDGMSIRATVRVTGASKNAIQRLTAELGPACDRFHRRFVHDVPCERLELDEMWTFTMAKDKNLSPDLRGQEGFGSTWTWLAFDPDHKLIVSYAVGRRDARTCQRLVRDVAYRVRGKVQITTDALACYLDAIGYTFQPSMVNYATLDKDYTGSDPRRPETRYSPGRIRRAETRIIIGDPDPEKISTSGVERMNLTLRMGSRRYTRLTNGHSKRFAYHCWALCMHLWNYNWARPHESLDGRTPAQAAGLTDHKFTIKDMLTLAMWTDEDSLKRIGA
jgi:IS1 family transposase